MGFVERNSLTCSQARGLVGMYLIDDPDLTSEQRDDFEAHIVVCPSCANEYTESQRVISLVRRYWQLSPDTVALLEEAGYPTTPPFSESAPPEPSREAPMTAQAAFEDFKRRNPDFAHGYDQQVAQHRRRMLFRRIGVAAALTACIALLAYGGWNACMSTRPAAPDANLVATNAVQSPLFFAERITPAGREPVQLGEPIACQDTPQEILIAGKHRVVMNTDTTATIRSAAKAHTSGGEKYAIQLAKGELYVEVVPGHAFEVTTPNAQLTITGTKFNVRTSPAPGSNRTDLTLLKGSVRLAPGSSDWGEAVDVTAGYASTVLSNTAPSDPHKVDALAATAWARELSFRNAFTSLTAQDIPLDLDDALWSSAQTDPSKLDYEMWRDKHQDWFAAQFPWVFEAQAALADQHGIETDYINLLMVSGDIWQFNYPRPPRKLGHPIATFAPAGVGRLARHYEVDAASLLAAIRPGSDATAITDTVRPGKAWADAIDHWRLDIGTAASGGESASADDLVLFSLRAGTYLTNTRTAAYLWVTAHPAEAQRLLADEDYLADYLAALMSKNVSTGTTWAARLGSV